VRALAISDTHFGAWTGRDLLREEVFLERLAPALEGSTSRRQPRPPPRPSRRREPVGGEAGRWGGAARGRLGPAEAARQRREQPAPDAAWPRPAYPAASVVSPSDPSEGALEAFARVVANLGWSRESDRIVFAHTHQPLADVRSRCDSRTRYRNTGSWIYEPDLGSRQAYARYPAPRLAGNRCGDRRRRARAALARAPRRPQSLERWPGAALPGSAYLMNSISSYFGSGQRSSVTTFSSLSAASRTWAIAAICLSRAWIARSMPSRSSG